MTNTKDFMNHFMLYIKNTTFEEMTKQDEKFIKEKITMWFKKKKKPKQTTFCYCDCGNELVSNHVDCYHGEDTLVHYTCPCGIKSAWDFYAPAPIFMGNE